MLLLEGEPVTYQLWVSFWTDNREDKFLAGLFLSSESALSFGRDVVEFYRPKLRNVSVTTAVYVVGAL